MKTLGILITAVASACQLGCTKAPIRVGNDGAVAMDVLAGRDAGVDLEDAAPEGPQANGAPCQGDGGACVSGHCVDNRCCAEWACSRCESCTGPGGTCAPVTNAEDPDSCHDLQKCDSAGVCVDRFAEFPVPGTAPTALGIVSGPDGNIWFNDFSNHMIGRMDTAGRYTEFTVHGRPQAVAAGPDGNVWFTDPDLSEIGRVMPDGIVTEFPNPFGGGLWMTAGPDGALWFITGDVIGRVDTSGVITSFPLEPGTRLNAITAGPDGNLWYTALGSNRIGRITPAGAVTEFVFPTEGADVGGLTAGPDQNIWICESGVNKVARMNLAGVVTAEFVLPTQDAGPSDIVSGLDGRLWVAELGAGQIAEITTAGDIHEYAIPTPASSPYDIELGPDGNVWFTEVNASQVGRFTP